MRGHRYGVEYDRTILGRILAIYAVCGCGWRGPRRSPHDPKDQKDDHRAHVESQKRGSATSGEA